MKYIRVSSSIQKVFDEVEQLKEAVTIEIPAGKYSECCSLRASNVRVIGLGEVIITHNRSANQIDPISGQKYGTFRTATLFVSGTNNHFENLTIENSAGTGREVGQAIALYADVDKTTFKNCQIIGYQDTLFTGKLPEYQKDGTDFQTPQRSHLQYYRQRYMDCFISGSVDFIFGGAEAVFKNCVLHSREDGYITAASTPKNQARGFVFENCQLTADSEVKTVYLGRPWRPYAKAKFIYTTYGSHIHPDGWDDWGNPSNRQTVEYVEITKDSSIKRPSWIKLEYKR